MATPRSWLEEDLDSVQWAEAEIVDGYREELNDTNAIVTH